MNGQVFFGFVYVNSGIMESRINKMTLHVWNQSFELLAMFLSSDFDKQENHRINSLSIFYWKYNQERQTIKNPNYNPNKSLQQMTSVQKHFGILKGDIKVQHQSCLNKLIRKALVWTSCLTHNQLRLMNRLC